MAGRSKRLAVSLAALAVCTTVAAALPAPSNSDLQVVRLDPDPVAPGGTTTVHGFVANNGPDRTASAFTVLIDLPAGMTFEGPYFPADCTASAYGHLLSCTFPAGLPAFGTATALAPVRVASSVPHGTVAVGHINVISIDDRNRANNSTSFAITVS